MRRIEDYDREGFQKGGKGKIKLARKDRTEVEDQRKEI